jgi:D-alanyl-D-alanine dipeptidase
MKPEVRRKLAETPIPCIGFNASGNPIGDDTGFRSVIAVEADDRDVLVPIEGVTCRAMYSEMGFTTDRVFYIREPALRHLRLAADRVRDTLGWTLRVTDAYRPAEVQRQGFMWAIGEVFRNRLREGLPEVRGWLGRLLSEGKMDSGSELRVQMLVEADNLFGSVAPQRADELRARHDADIPWMVLVAATNLGVIDWSLERDAMGCHSSGGVVDLEFLSSPDGTLVFMGSPVDAQGAFSALGYFEPHTATILEAAFPHEWAQLQTEVQRKALYRTALQSRPDLVEYVTACDGGRGVTHKSFDDLWLIARANRRLAFHALSYAGIEFYGAEWWHVDLKNMLGGRQAEQGLIGGGPALAVYAGLSTCVWGNARQLYEGIGVQGP